MDIATGSVFYLERGHYKEQKPYFCCIQPALLRGKPTTNHVHVEVPITVQSMRDKQTDFSLEFNGFEFVTDHPLDAIYSYEKMQESPELLARYDREMEAFFLERFGAKKVVVFDHEVGASWKPGLQFVLD